jgi:hypothetical protein
MKIIKNTIRTTKSCFDRCILILVLFITTANNTFGQTVKINELMYAPKNGEPEWIELYNSSLDKRINIKGWKIRHHTATWYTISVKDFYIQPNSFLVLTKSDTIHSFRRIDSSMVLVCPLLPASFLVNTGDTISIHDSSDALVDSAFYDPSWGGSSGKSLERVSPEIAPYFSTNWKTSIDPSGATPGKRNSTANLDYDLEISSFDASLRQTDSTVMFNITVKNVGFHSTSPFDVNCFIDYNNDLIPQLEELTAIASSITGLQRGDSIHISLKATPKNYRGHNAIAIIKYLSDQDTTNNFKVTNIKFSYNKKSLVINEIMYNPKSPEPKWIELYNTTDDSINVNSFNLANYAGTNTQITKSDYFILPKGYIVIASDTNFNLLHPELGRLTLIAKIASLNKAGDSPALHDACGNLIDSVSYSPSWGENVDGKSLERIMSEKDSNDPLNWLTSVDSSGSTPARINSVSPRNYDLAIGNIEYFPKSLQAGSEAIVSAYIINRGLKPSEPASVIFFNDRNSNGFCDAGEAIDSMQVEPLSPGDSTIVNFVVRNLPYGQITLGILANYPADELVENNRRITLLQVGAPRSSVVLNEIMYAPKSPEQEWIELYNTTNLAIDLSSFTICTRSGSTKLNPGSVISPNDYAVICKDSSASWKHYPIKNLIRQSVPSLSNGGDWISLHDKFENPLDSMAYDPSYGGTNGKSLERIDYLNWGDSTNWHESVDSTGATPGRINSTAKLPFDVCLKKLDCESTIEVNQSSQINLTIQNTGRNALDSIKTNLTIFNTTDGDTIFSEISPLTETLLPNDTAKATFLFTPSRPGEYTILANTFQPQDQRSWNNTLSSAVFVRYPPQTIVINEIMFTNGKMGEYFEIYNTSHDPIAISDWWFHISSTKRLPLSSTLKTLKPNSYFIVANDSSVVDFVSDTSSVQITKSLSLPDNGSWVTVSDPTGMTIDSVCYSPSWHNGDIARTFGRSLEKINPSLPSNSRTSWSTSVSQYGGTPGSKNSVFISETKSGSSNPISVAPNPFSPDGDGINDFTFIEYSFQVPFVKVRARIFDSIGRLIAVPLDNVVLQPTGKIVWDGRDSSGKIVKFGLYVLLVEVTGPDGKAIYYYKAPLIVAKKMK